MPKSNYRRPAFPEDERNPRYRRKPRPDYGEWLKRKISEKEKMKRKKTWR